MHSNTCKKQGLHRWEVNTQWIKCNIALKYEYHRKLERKNIIPAVCFEAWQQDILQNVEHTAGPCPHNDTETYKPLQTDRLDLHVIVK